MGTGNNETDMMTPDQSKTVADVYRQFLESEEGAAWDDMDEQMVHLDYLEDDQLQREAEVLLTHHLKGTVQCSNEFCNQGCYAVRVTEAVGYILDLYKKTGNLHKNNRYVLENYLALSHLGLIVSTTK